MVFNDKTYNFLKWFARIVLPACGTLYFALAGIWNFPYGEQIIGSLTALNVFFGILLGISSHEYNKEHHEDGQLLIDNSDPGKDIYRLDLGANLEFLGDKKTITLSVKPNQHLSE